MAFSFSFAALAFPSASFAAPVCTVASASAVLAALNFFSAIPNSSFALDWSEADALSKALTAPRANSRSSSAFALSAFACSPIASLSVSCCFSALQ